MAEENQKRYQVQVKQKAMVVVEQFDFTATSEEDALKQGQKFLNDHKSYEKGSYELAVKEINPAEELPVGEPGEPGNPEANNRDNGLEEDK